MSEPIRNRHPDDQYDDDEIALQNCPAHQAELEQMADIGLEELTALALFDLIEQQKSDCESTSPEKSNSQPPVVPPGFQKAYNEL